MFDWIIAIPVPLIVLIVFLTVGLESLGLPLPGETVLITAVLIAGAHDVGDVLFVAAAAALSAIIGDSIGYALGKVYGVRLLGVLARKFPQHFTADRVRAAVDLMHRWGAWMVIAGRFVVLLRVLAGPLAGMLGMRYRNFLIANITGAVLWVSVITLITNLVGDAARSLLHALSWGGLAIAIVAIFVIAVILLQRNRQRAQLQADPQHQNEIAQPSPTELDLDALLLPPQDDPNAWGPATLATAAGDILRKIWRLMLTHPFTASMIVIILAMAVITGALFVPFSHHSWSPYVAYGLPALEQGRVWTVITGAFFAQLPMLYVPVLLGLALIVGMTEHRFGTTRTVAVFAGGHLAGVLGSLILIASIRNTSWEWAHLLSTSSDTGPSGGILACLAALIVTLGSPWRRRLTFLLAAYVTIFALYIGTLTDLVHFFSVVPALLLLPAASKRRGLQGTPSQREYRLLAFTGLIIIAVVQVIVSIVPAHGPLGQTGADHALWTDLAIDLVIIALVANGILTGRRLSWWFVLVLGVFNILTIPLIGILLVTGDATTHGLGLTIASAVLWSAELAVIIVGRKAFTVPMRRSRRILTGSAAKPLTEAQEVSALVQQSGGSTISWMATWPHNMYFYSPSGESFIAYQQHSDAVIALGDPVGPDHEREQLITDFLAAADRLALTPCFFSASEKTSEEMPSGWRSLVVAEDTLVDLPDLTLKGKKWQAARSAINRAEREEISFRLSTLSKEPWGVQAQVRAISEQWVGDKNLPEMGFTLGSVDEAMDPSVKVGLAIDPVGNVHGVTSWLPVYGPHGRIQGWTLDLMRRRDGGFKYVMEFLIASSALAFQEQGAEFISLSGAPLATTGSTDSPTLIEQLADKLGEALEPLYGFRSLHAFKSKFNPRYEPMYLLYPEEADLPRIVLGLTHAYLPEATWKDFLAMGKDLQRA